MKILLIVDLQKQFSNNKKYNKCLNYIENSRADYDQTITVMFSQISPNDENPAYDKLPDYNPRSGTNMKFANEKDLEFNESGLQIIIRNTYHSNYIREIIQNEPDLEIDIIGSGLESSILDIAFDLFDNKINFHIIEDLTYANTLTENSSLNTLKNIYESNFGKDIFTESKQNKKKQIA